MFVDRAKIFIKSGKGGNGSVSFRREPFVPQGGPDGGDGGKGGDVVITADENLRTLMDFRYKKKYEAQGGEDGKKKNQYGKGGDDLHIRVPVGTLVIDAGTKTVMKDLKVHGDQVIAARGGRGGRGNVHFKNSVRQAPNFAEAGGFAVEKGIELVLKLIADVGLVGYPNVGKSTLLSVSTSASPKIGNYHFTTTTPNLGVVNIFDSSFVLADIPGLIEGASDGLGLGLDFLKHIERTKVLIHVVDVAGSEGREPLEDFHRINEEMKAYSAKLAQKPQIVAANKTDLADAEAYRVFKEAILREGYSVYPICAPIGEGVDALMAAAFKALKECDQDEAPEIVEYYDPKQPEEEEGYREIYIRKDGEKYVLTGMQLEKIFNSTNFNDSGSLRYLHKYIEEKGAIERLKEMGLQDGDVIRVIDYDFEYWDE
ncbi:MAG: GTPase ObgE [Eubacteriales bacterium]|jgi:GTP-binding protein|nr:GTPase ObgE [Eubacteriales bacterium]MDD3863730.1 GTPase ObgE [Eubacteriales bacterium]